MKSKKAELWKEGRKAQRSFHWPQKKHQRIWIHCASVGEFEQGRPVIEALKNQDSSIEIILTFFSPSGYESQKNYSLANVVLYLPLDGKKVAQKFIEQLQPDLAIFVKYEFWYYYLSALHQKNIPTYLISAVFRSHQIFFKSWGHFYRSMLHCYTQIFVQDHRSQHLLQSIHIGSEVAGDTRYDRVMAIAERNETLPEIAAWVGHAQVMMMGSSWPEDEKIMAAVWPSFPAEWKLIIAPHEISEAGIARLKKYFKEAITYSDWVSQHHPSNVLIIDNVGMLSRMYRYAQLAHVGGGWENGIHNILEPAAFGLPVFFGPQHEKFVEAKTFIAYGFGFEIQNQEQYKQVLSGLLTDDCRHQLSTDIKNFMQQQMGATQIISSFIHRQMSDKV